MNFIFDNGTERKNGTAGSAKKNARRNFYGNALGACNGWKRFIFRPVKCKKRMRDGAESANRRDPKRNSAMHQKVASNSKRRTLSGQPSGVRLVNGCVVTVSTARNHENGVITIASNVANRNTKKSSRMPSGSSLQRGTGINCDATRASTSTSAGKKLKKNSE